MSSSFENSGNAEIIAATPGTQSFGMAQSFASLLEELMESLKAVFPECNGLKEVSIMLKNLVLTDKKALEDLMDMWNDQLRPHEAAIKNRDPEPILALMEGHHAMNAMRIREKWNDPDFGPDSQEAMWEYFDRLSDVARMHGNIPENMRNAMEKLTRELMEKMQSGEMSMEDLGRIDMHKLGIDLLQQSSPEDLEKFQNNLGAIFGSLQSAGLAGLADGQAVNPNMFAALLGQR